MSCVGGNPRRQDLCKARGIRTTRVGTNGGRKSKGELIDDLLSTGFRLEDIGKEQGGSPRAPARCDTRCDTRGSARGRPRAGTREGGGDRRRGWRHESFDGTSDWTGPEEQDGEDEGEEGGEVAGYSQPYGHPPRRERFNSAASSLEAMAGRHTPEGGFSAAPLAWSSPSAARPAASSGGLPARFFTTASPEPADPESERFREYVRRRVGHSANRCAASFQ